MTAQPKPQIFDLPNRLARQDRQPQSVADFVLIDPYNFSAYQSMAWLYDKLPYSLLMAKAKDEHSKKHYPRKLVNLFSHFTPIPKTYIFAIVFDLDPQANDFNFMAWSDVGLPPPNIIVNNPNKVNSCQIWYLIESPIHIKCDSNKQPLPSRANNLLNAIYACMLDKLNADKHFSRSRCKNPFSPEHDTYVSGAKPYTLQQLREASEVDLRNEKRFKTDLPISGSTIPPKTQTLKYEQSEPSNEPKFHDTGLSGTKYWQCGRNGECFEIYRHVGYDNAWRVPDDLYNFLFEKIKAHQKHFDTPLDDRECAEIARSITKYCIEHFGAGTGKRTKQFKEKGSKHFDSSTEAQTFRIKMRWTGYDDKKAQAKKMLKDKVKQVDICRELGIAKSTLFEWKKEFQKKSKKPIKINKL